MSTVRLVLYKEHDGSVPVIEFLDGLLDIIQLKAFARLLLLESKGHQLRRPRCDYLGNAIYELRFRHIRTQYRLLYFFHGQKVVVVSHGLTKKDKVPEIEIERAVQRRERYLQDPLAHSYCEVWRHYEQCT